MDDLNLSLPAQNHTALKHWQARLNLDFAKQHQRSFLTKNLHVGPLVLQKTLHPEGEGVCHGVVIHPPGGVAGGDALTINVNVDEGAHALLTTPGAGKWYKANGQQASQQLQFNLQKNACFEWLPQENILFDGSAVKFSAEINLASEANYAGWEILCFGRQAQKEIWKTGHLHQNLAIKRENKLIWNEQTFLKPDQALLQSIVGLNQQAVSASFVVAAGAVPVEVLNACRQVKVNEIQLNEKQPNLALELHARYGVTALPQIFSARYVGQSAQSARHYFEQLWQILRPWYAGREVTRPRIWNT